MAAAEAMREARPMNAEGGPEGVRTPEEELAWERTSPGKHEYCDGEVFAADRESLKQGRPLPCRSPRFIHPIATTVRWKRREGGAVRGAEGAAAPSGGGAAEG